jgi:type I restriction enzyme, S subunit
LPAHLYDLFPDRLVESELGEIPEGWKVSDLGMIATNPKRGVQPGEVAPDTPYIALEHMPRRSLLLCEWGSASTVKSGKFQFKRGELLFGKLRPYFHKVGIAPIDGVCSTDIVVVASNKPHYSAFSTALISSDEFVEFTNAGSTGTKMPRTSWGEMSGYRFCMPAESVMKSYEEFAGNGYRKLASLVEDIRRLTTLRDTLLPKLISGELRLNDAERFVANAA